MSALMPDVSLAPVRGPSFVQTLGVAAIIAAVVLGGLGLDRVIAAPSAGTVGIGGTVTLRAEPGWTLVGSASDGKGVRLQKGDAFLNAIIDPNVSGSAADILVVEKRSLGDGSAQVSFGDDQQAIVGIYDAAMVRFEAMVSSSGGSGNTGIVDGELVCVVVDGQSVVVDAYAPQGSLVAVSTDLATMIQSVGVTR